MVPRSQKNRPISFLLFDKDTFVAGRDLIIRPEELTRQEPFRNAVTQTLGGAWLDDFGMGVSTITIAGHTSWHGSASEDGVDQFVGLRDLLVNRWKDERDNKAKSGNPDDIRLVFADQLDGIVVYVAIQHFQLRRNKSRPLLMQYNISMSVLGPLDDASSIATAQDFIVDAINSPKRTDLAMAGMTEAQRKNAELAEMLAGTGLSSRVVIAAKGMLDTSTALLSQVKEIAKAANGAVNDATRPFLVASAMILQASHNVTAAMAAVEGIGENAKSVLSAISGNLLDAYCNLTNGFRRLFTVPDFGDLFGASNCSSTGGGRAVSPWVAENPFALLAPPGNGSGLAVSGAASAAIQAARTDLLAEPLTMEQAADLAGTIAAGVSVDSTVPTTTAPTLVVPGYRLAETNMGDDLQAIAAREMGDASRWYTLIDLNGLSPPYLTDDASLVRPGVLLSGSPLRIPTSAAQVLQDENTDDVFGRDVLLAQGELVVENGDLSIVSGVDNLKQAMGVLLITDHGELVYHPSYGCATRRFIGESNLAANALVAGGLVKRAVAADPRINRVIDASAEVSGDALRISVTAEAINKVPVTAEVI